jgi:hypothetical protein
MVDETTVRVVKFQLSSGETETLVTNLFALPVGEFSELYFKGTDALCGDYLNGN